MPFIDIDGSRMYYRLDGIDDRPVLVLSHSLGCDHGQDLSIEQPRLPSHGIVRKRLARQRSQSFVAPFPCLMSNQPMPFCNAAQILIGYGHRMAQRVKQDSVRSLLPHAG